MEDSSWILWIGQCNHRRSYEWKREAGESVSEHYIVIKTQLDIAALKMKGARNPEMQVASGS